MTRSIVSGRPCCLCRGSTAEFTWEEPRGRLVRCVSCSLVYADLIQAIDSTYWADHELDTRDASDFYWDLVRRRVYSLFLEKYTRPGERLLDVGSGKGYFVAMSRQASLLADGLEVSSQAVRWASDHHGPWFQQGLIEAGHLPEATYDLVTLWDVIEHVPNPLEVLLACARVLKPGGRVFLQTPNVNFHLPYARVKRLVGFDRSRGTYLELPDHLNHFSPSTLARMCSQARLERAVVLVLPPISTVAGRRSQFLAGLKIAYVQLARGLHAALGINISNSVQLIAFRSP